MNIRVFSVPDDPTKPDWPSQVADSGLHTVHNLQIVDCDGDNKDDILFAAKEEVGFLKRFQGRSWVRVGIGPTDEDRKDFKGASEVKRGKLANGLDYYATIEPWHGNQVVVYAFDGNGRPNRRKVVDEPISWGHAVWCADLDGDGDDELIIGQRDPNKGDSKTAKGPGVWVYDPKGPKTELSFDRHDIDDGGMACEDALAADLDGDGKPEIIAGGRATHNVKIYWNQGAGKKP